MKRIVSIFLTNHQANTKLLKWANRFSPVVATDKEPKHNKASKTQDKDRRYWGINLDATGNERLFKGERNLIKRISSELKNLQIPARIAIAPTLGAAWAVSRYGANELGILQKEDLQKTLSSLPIEALRISNKLKKELKEVHIHQIGFLLNIPHRSLVSRFGPEILEQLDCAFGKREEPIESFQAPFFTYKEKSFNGPVKNLAAIQSAIEELTNSIVRELEKKNQKIARLNLALKREELPSIGKTFTFSCPTLDKGHLWSLTKLYLEQTHLGHGILGLSITVSKSEPLKAVQQTTGRNKEALLTQNKKYLGELLDNYKEYLGNNNVLELCCRESHIPENSFYYSPFTSRVRTEAILAVDRPSILFSQPRRIKAMTVMPDKPPFWLKWQGKTYSPSKSIGPERIAPEWWGKDNQTFTSRDYFKVQLPSGVWLWIYRELQSSNWFVHGIWA